jgi:phosphinothricin acetyltransferase
MSDPVLRTAAESDVPAIQAIYAHHVTHGLGSFEETPPDLAEISRRRADVDVAGLPYLVCAAAGAVVGFAYAAPYRPRPAYRYSVEDSVYVAPGCARQGHGRRLVAALIERCTALGYRQMLAVIGDRDNHGSIGLHRALGFREVGHLPAVGFKHGRWVDVVMMQRALGDGDRTKPA